MEAKTPVSHSDIKGMEAKMPGNLKGMEKKKTKKTPVSPSDLKWMEAKIFFFFFFSLFFLLLSFGSSVDFKLSSHLRNGVSTKPTLKPL